MPGEASLNLRGWLITVFFDADQKGVFFPMMNLRLTIRTSLHKYWPRNINPVSSKWAPNPSTFYQLLANLQIWTIYTRGRKSSLEREDRAFQSSESVAEPEVGPWLTVNLPSLLAQSGTTAYSCHIHIHSMDSLVASKIATKHIVLCSHLFLLLRKIRSKLEWVPSE